MQSPDFYESLSPEERLRRAGALFLEAAILACIRREAASGHPAESSPAASGGNAGSPSPELEAALLQEDEIDLLRRYAGFGEVTPREAGQFWSASRTTTYRRLLRLEQSGWVVREGATTATRYRFTHRTLALLERVERNGQARDGAKSR